MTDGSGAKDEARDMVVARRRHGGARLMAVRAKGWTPAKRERFLDTLAATAHVKMAAAAAGINRTNAYRLRRRDPVFAGLWLQALELGYQRLEDELLSLALGNGRDAVSDGRADAINAIEPDGDRVDVQIDVELGLRVLALRRAEGTAPGPRTRGYKFVPIEEVEAVLAKQLDLLAARLRRKGGGDGERDGDGGGGLPA
ncbi:hypothetical protein FSB78_15350 [Sphingomonas ginsenosidivorax]|uniref:Terminase n=1 Tax=Sphingomonas ginsenosidivorax TaxID=862135 RepID=A0A5C6UIH1_9SPHN|nr:hypothetical protein [Sphingomonas ginsenosidivorax]TXC72164.1 hypothetical protein FSB78_15350 [Sphingomonas ginsenosidivorax]